MRFIENSGLNYFPSAPIEINQNLASIIGGKSTGKSLLLYYMAKTIDRKEVETRFAHHAATTEYSFGALQEFDFEVKWTDGFSSHLKRVERENDAGNRKILYIPHNYLNSLSEKDAIGRDTLNQFVKDVLLQDESAREDYERNLGKIKNLSKSIGASVANLYQIKQEIEGIEEKIKQLGEEKGITEYIARLRKDADGIKTESDLSEQEIRDYEALLEEENDTATTHAALSDDKKNLASFRQDFSRQLGNLEQLRDAQVSHLRNEELKKEFAQGLAGIGQINTNLLAGTDKIIASVNTKINLHQKRLDQIENELLPFLARVELQDELKRKNESISNEQKNSTRLCVKRKTWNQKRVTMTKKRQPLLNPTARFLASTMR